MAVRPTVLCAVDFSDASRGALRYAATLAEHFYATLIVLTVNDPFLIKCADAAVDEGWLEKQTKQELETFVHDAFPGRTPQVPEIRMTVAAGEPAMEILRSAAKTPADAIVMSTHGLSGVRKMIFGSTTERVLRETELPVVVTPASDPGPESLEDWRASVKTVLVPVDFSEYTPRQVRVACALAEALATSVVLTHVVEPLHIRPRNEQLRAYANETRRVSAHHRLEELLATVPQDRKPLILLGAGDPATEIARVAKEQRAGAIVVGLHSSPGSGRQMGAVTYRLVCQTPVLVVAWPPERESSRLLSIRVASDRISRFGTESGRDSSRAGPRHASGFRRTARAPE